MSTTLTNGLKLPDKGSVDWYADMQNNYAILDGAVGTIAEHTSALSEKAPLVHTHTKGDITDFPAYGTTAGTICEGNDSRLSDARTPVAHTHVTADVTDLLNTTHEWTKEQVCDEGFTAKSTTIERCVTPETIKHINFTFKDKNNKGIGAVRRYFRNNGVQELQIFGNTKIKDNQYDETGSDVYFGFSESIKPDGTKAFTFDGYMGSNLEPLLANQSIGTFTNQWNNLYAKNYYYNGVAWGLNKANIWTQDQTIATSNDKCYIIKDTVYELGQTYPNGEHLGGLVIQDKNGSVVGLIDITDRSYGSTEMRIRVQQKFDPNSNNRSTSGAILWNEMTIGIASDKTNYLRLDANLIGPNHDLGTSTNKWKSLNGCNPGALSLPDNSVYYSFNTDNFVYTGAYNEVTVPKKGWLYLRLVECNQDAYIACSSSTGNVDYPVFSVGTILNRNTDKYEVNFLMPLSVTTFRLYIYKTQGILTQHKVFYTEGMIQ